MRLRSHRPLAGYRVLVALGPLFLVGQGRAGVAASAASAAPAAPAAPAASPAPAPAPPDGAVQVYLKTEAADARLYRELPDAEPEHVCGAPCGAWVDPRQRYRIAGLGLAPSRPFSLGAELGPPPLLLDVRAFPAAKRRVLLYVTLAGVGLILGGAVVLGGTATAAAKRCDGIFGTCSGLSDGERTAYYALGGVAIAAGIGVALGGGVQLARAHTAVAIRPAAPAQP